MMISYNKFHDQLYRMFSQDPELNSIPLDEILNSIPTVDSLHKIPEGTPVIIRTDLDVPVKDDRVSDYSRLDSALPTIKYCLERRWKVIIFGHIGREKDRTLRAVCEALSERIGKEIKFIPEWIDESRSLLDDNLISSVNNAGPASLFMLENTRKYDIERALWKAKERDFDNICERMYTLASDFRERLCEIEINEAIAASNFDFSSSVLPLVMAKTALGFFISEELRKHIIGARKANMVVFSGLKINKLDDLEAVLESRPLKLIIAAGSLAMALKKAQAQLEGRDFCIGRSETDEKEKFFISPERIEQGKRIIKKCDEKRVELVLPLDFILDTGEESENIPKERAQFDIGPKSRKHIEEKIQEYIEKSKASQEPFTLFYNGVFGKFEDPKFEAGTKEFISLLQRMTRGGISTYVGGGEGRQALLKYGSLSDVTHAFTAGGTILKSLSDRHIHYLKCMYLQNREAENAG